MAMGTFFSSSSALCDDVMQCSLYALKGAAGRRISVRNSVQKRHFCRIIFFFCGRRTRREVKERDRHTHVHSLIYNPGNISLSSHAQVPLSLCRAFVIIIMTMMCFAFYLFLLLPPSILVAECSAGKSWTTFYVRNPFALVITTKITTLGVHHHHPHQHRKVKERATTTMASHLMRECKILSFAQVHKTTHGRYQ